MATFRHISTIIAILFLASHGVNAGKPATAGLQVQQQCGPQLLEQKGVSRNWAPAMAFDQDQIFISPEKPRIPGCFNLTALNVSINRDLTRGLTAEFEMRIGKVPDISLPKLKCKSRLSDCGCGTNNSCMYCDFCSHIKQHVPELRFKETSWGMRQSRHKYDVDSGRFFDPCECEIEKGVYDIRVEICTPDSAELNTVLPAAVIALVGQGTTFTLWTTVNMYDIRFQVFDGWLSPVMQDQFIKRLTKNHLIGCHVIGTNIFVPFT